MAGIELRSPAFNDHGTIPRNLARDGGNERPPLEWTGVPPEAAEVAVLVEDPDAPSGTFVHWVLAGLPPEDGAIDGDLPAGAVEGRNDFGEEGWAGPQPPIGDDAHRYFFRVFATKRPLGLRPGASAEDLRSALRDNELASGTIVGTFQR